MQRITQEEIRIILQTKKAFIFIDGKPWIKKGNKLFDVTMGSWDGLKWQPCRALPIISDLRLDIGLYRDDGLGVCNLPPRQAVNPGSRRETNPL